jgi:hypothetical protein
MAQSPRGGYQVQKDEERLSESGSQNSRATGTPRRDGEAARRQTERVVEVGSEQMRKATEASDATASGTLRAGSAVASDAQEITAAWARYAEEVMHTSEASQALLRARTFAEMLEVQAKLLRDNMQSFVDQSARIAEAAGRMATGPFNALKEASGERSRH